MLDKYAIAGEEWFHSFPLETIDRSLGPLAAKPPGEEEFGEVIGEEGRVGSDG
jgi:hypothetical protein